MAEMHEAYVHLTRDLSYLPGTELWLVTSYSHTTGLWEDSRDTYVEAKARFDSLVFAFTSYGYVVETINNATEKEL